MTKQRVIKIVEQLFQAALLIVFLAIAVQVTPRLLGQDENRDINRSHPNVDTPSLEQQSNFWPPAVPATPTPTPTPPPPTPTPTPTPSPTPSPTPTPSPPPTPSPTPSPTPTPTPTPTPSPSPTPTPTPTPVCTID